MQRCLGSYIKDHRERERKGGWPGGGQGRVRGVRAGPSGAEGEDVSGGSRGVPASVAGGPWPRTSALWWDKERPRKRIC